MAGRQAMIGCDLPLYSRVRGNAIRRPFRRLECFVVRCMQTRGLRACIGSREDGWRCCAITACLGCIIFFNSGIRYYLLFVDDEYAEMCDRYTLSERFPSTILSVIFV